MQINTEEVSGFTQSWQSKNDHVVLKQLWYRVIKEASDCVVFKQ